MLNGKNNSLKEYYIKLQSLYNNAVNMITAINQSLTTSASEISLNIEDISSNKQTTVRIPSFIYLENKLEQLNSNFNNLFKMPDSGEAWFSNENNMYKLQLLKSNVSPVIPEFTTNNIFAYTKQNNLFKDLVNPKTYIKLNIDNLPNNISTMYMKKIIFHSVDLYEALINKNIASYNDFKAAVYNLQNGVDYSEYDSEIKLPIKQEEYNAYFDIIEIPQLEGGNPYTFNNIENNTTYTKLRYNIRLNTLKYSNVENDAIIFELKIGDQLTLLGSNTIYNIIDINKTTNMLIIEESVGHSSLQTINQNSEMVLTLYNQNFDKYKYVELPLEENEYICIFIGTVYNNIRSLYSAPLYVNLNDIVMKDEFGNVIYKDNSSTPMTYIEYYNKYCKNIGDLMLGFIETTYPQLSNYTELELKELQDSDVIKNLVSASVNGDSILKVQKINDHLIDDLTSNSILNLHNEKSQLNGQLSSLQSNIDQVYSQLVTTDFSQETTLTQESLKAKLNDYYNQRVTLQKQQIAIVDNINVLKGNAKGIDSSKFRIRGITKTEDIEIYLKDNYNSNCTIIGLDVEYKYKSVNSDTTNVSIIDKSIFSDWNKLNNIDKERKLKFNDDGTYSIIFENYDNNIIKWNQIDIPITQGEDVIIRVRYKYCVGQPFINLYTPWSDEFVVIFPTEFTEINEISSIISDNNDDIVNSKFNNTLINEGYQEHITNKIVDNSQVYYHMPENIYSGFNTPENKLISLKDKLQDISNELEKYKSIIDNELNSNYEIYVEFDNKSIPIYDNTVNNIICTDINNNDSYIKKNINLIIKNTGTTQLKFYSLFPGDSNDMLISAKRDFYNKHIVDYERVPLLYGDSLATEIKDIIYIQKLGQWLYFRQTNPFTNVSLYNPGITIGGISAGEYIPKNNMQLLYGDNNLSNDPMALLETFVKYTCENKIILKPDVYNTSTITPTNTSPTTTVLPDEFIIETALTNALEKLKVELYKNQSNTLSNINNNNGFLLCYENIKFTEIGKEEGKPHYLDQTIPISNLFGNDYKLVDKNSTKQYISDISDLYGGFLIPKLNTDKDLLCDVSGANQYKTLDVGKTLSIPLLFEYYLTNETTQDNIEKTIAFDLKPSLMKDPIHYVISFNGKYNYSASNINN